MTSADLITSAEAAEVLGVDLSTISRWSDTRLPADERKLTPHMRAGRGKTGAKLFRRLDVEQLANELGRRAS